uniref:Reelin domain-containing protein n=1 Tax=Steinernema glaseri TaxID=37863 RepID=A0A1I7Y0B7_9BILA
MRLFLLSAALLGAVVAWPDGAPCVHAAYESMNPLEAVEHQGGLQLTVPPYTIELEQKCYWKSQPIGIVLKGNTTRDKFKGFVIQPIVYQGARAGRRIGQFLRLDDNGSWQQQCFRLKDSVTHSHQENKKKLRLWWKNDDDDSVFVQFVATVVKAQKIFWVRSVVSEPLPPCRVQRTMTGFVAAHITPPPAVKQFKMDTWRQFNLQASAKRSIEGFAPENVDEGRIQDIQFATRPVPTTPSPLPPPPVVVTRPVPVPVAAGQPVAQPVMQPKIHVVDHDVISQPTPPPTTSIPSVQRQKLTRIIPMPHMISNKPHLLTTPQPILRPEPIVVQQQFVPQQQHFVPQQQQQFIPQQQQFAPQPFQQARTPFQAPRMVARPQVNQCFDMESPANCFMWAQRCGDNAYVQRFCRRACRFC